MQKKLLIFIVSYQAEKFIESVLERIPKEIWNSSLYQTEVLIVDDSSKDRTFFVAEEFQKRNLKTNLTVLVNPKNQGYGGNQKIGYYYAIKNGFDVVILLHGDGQYAPELIPQMIDPILSQNADAVFGSRMIHKMNALKGGMPLYKWVGNQILTWLENRILGAHLSEFHSGYRAYRVQSLAKLPFSYNSDYFDFDTDIIIQLINTRMTIKEIPIPTFYGKEISRVNGIKYAFLIIFSCLLAKIQKWGIFYHPKFDFLTKDKTDQPKFHFSSSHSFALNEVVAGSTVLDLAAGPGYMAKELAKKNIKTISVDEKVQPQTQTHSFLTIQEGINKLTTEPFPGAIDAILALDVIEHLQNPEEFLKKLREAYSNRQPKIIITTGNVAFLTLRIGLLFGKFNYSKRGILDLEHHRLFTFSTLKRSLKITGYEVEKELGIPAPFPLALGNTALSRTLLRLNQFLIRLSKQLFAYQIAIVARPKTTLNELLERAYLERAKKLKAL